ncbi:MAG TPA: ABC transporter permease [Terriglobia bacterium]|nr:ABC transporter permease [Terriglobia bacterium]
MPEWSHEIAPRLAELNLGPSREADIIEELAQHLEDRYQELLVGGTTEATAYRTALEELCDKELLSLEMQKVGHEVIHEPVKAGTTERRGILQDFWLDLRFGLRLLYKDLGFTVVAVLTMALGIGANTAIFSVVNAVLLRPLPYPESNRLLTIQANQSLMDVSDVAAASHSFSAGGAVNVLPMDYAGRSEPVRIDAALVSAGLFPALGVQPLWGRAISSQEDVIGGPRLAVLSQGFWQQTFAGDPHIVDKTISISGNNYTVIGVMPARFTLPESPADIFVSLRVAYPEAAEFRGVHFMRSYWRLKSGVKVGQAQAELSAIDRRLAEQYPAEDKGRQSLLIPLRDRVVGDMRPTLAVLSGAVGLVLLISCVNFASLLLARTVSRKQEIEVRAALGAGSTRLIRQMLTESAMLALAGGIAGLLLARWGIGILLTVKPEQLARVSNIAIDLRVLLFLLATSIFSGILFGLAPAWSACQSSTRTSLKGTGRSSTASMATHRLRSGLVVAELGMALVLLAGASLLIQGFRRLSAVDPGFEPLNVLTTRLQLPQSRYAEASRQTQFRRQVLTGLNTLPGVQASMISEIPMGGEFVFHNFLIEGQAPVASGTEPEIQTRSVMGDYFRIMHIALRAGRSFTSQDLEDSPPVGIVNEAAVKQYFPHQNPIGARIRWANENPPRWFTIVGVIADVRHFGLNQPDQPAFYNLYSQDAQPWKRWMNLMIRTHDDPAMLIQAVKKEVWKVDNQIPVMRVQTMSQVMAVSLAERRFSTLLLGIFAAVAVSLAAVGVYGIIAYSVGQRKHEICIRVALGAEKGDVLRLIVGHGVLLTMAGIGVGLVGALTLTRFLSSMLYGIRPSDPFTFAGVAILLAAVAFVACYIPARRAATVDPMVVLRYE